MSKSVEIELNSAGIRELLRSEEMKAVLVEKASEIAARCGAGYEYDSHLTPGRVVSSVYTDTPEATKDNSANNTILRNLS